MRQLSKIICDEDELTPKLLSKLGWRTTHADKEDGGAMWFPKDMIHYIDKCAMGFKFPFMVDIFPFSKGNGRYTFYLSTVGDLSKILEYWAVLDKYGYRTKTDEALSKLRKSFEPERYYWWVAAGRMRKKDYEFWKKRARFKRV